MKPLHPNWQETREETLAIAHVPVLRSVSRRPAAIVGVILTLVLGLTYSGALESAMTSLERFTWNHVAALTDIPPATNRQIRITSKGAEPPSLSVPPGATITWINEDSVLPHIIASETLLDAGGNLLYTPVMFPGDRQSFTISPSLPAGSYQYESTTSPTVSGLVIVGQAALIAPSPPPAAVGTPESLTVPGNAPPLNPKIDETDVSQEALIPVNPYTVKGGREHPFSDTGEPIEELFGKNPAKASPAVTAHRPVKQPQTGPTLWVIGMLSVVGCLWVTKKYLCTIEN